MGLYLSTGGTVSFVGSGTDRRLAVEGYGDFDGNGIADIVLSEMCINCSTAGQVHIFLGETLVSGSVSIANADYTIVGMGADDAGSSGIGDFDGDGLSDIVIGARFSDYNGNDYGAAYIVFGSTLLASSDPTIVNYDLVLEGDEEDGHYGNYVTTIPDIDGDANPDILISAFRSDSNTGRAYIYQSSDFFGISTLPISDSPYQFYGELSNALFGASIHGVSDITQDVLTDILIGAPGEGSSGRVYVYSACDY